MPPLHSIFGGYFSFEGASALAISRLSQHINLIKVFFKMLSFLPSLLSRERDSKKQSANVLTASSEALQHFLAAAFINSLSSLKSEAQELSK